MDISATLFMTPNESLAFLEQMHSEGHGIFFMIRWLEWVRISPREPLPKKLATVLRRSNKSGSHSVYVAIDDHAPNERDPEKLIAHCIVAKLGALCAGTLFKTSISVRSRDAGTLTAMRRAKRWLTTRSTTGVLEFGLPNGRGTRVNNVRCTVNAREAFRSGTLLRQPGVFHVGYGIALSR